ncbi:MAG: hypothetical protein AB7P50_12740 [Alphaproteobacteria bacterium]
MSVSGAIESHRGELIAAASGLPFIVFLCGPSLRQTRCRPSARLRERLYRDLAAAKFEVILGEDDGLENSRLDLGINAQDNELEFIRSYCNAVVIIADSVGAFCELGLFSWHFVHRDGVLRKNGNTDCIVLINEKYKKYRSYLNEGPAAAVNGFGKLEFVNFAAYDSNDIIKRLSSRRGVMTMDRRGRPRKSSP